MKLRIKDNSVRMRLTRSELIAFGEEGYLEANTVFVSNILTYALQIRPDEYGHELSADFKNNTVIIYMPEKMAKDWVTTDIVGFETWMDLDSDEKLYLLLEKDFKCLDEAIEDQSDNFDNPLAMQQD